MLQIDLKHLPTSDELPDSDDTPVDNEDQNFGQWFRVMSKKKHWNICHMELVVEDKL